MALLKRYDGSKKFKIKDFDPGYCGGLTREEGDAKFLKLSEELAELNDLLYATQDTPLLVVLQGMDTAGKDGTVRGVIGAMNPQSCRVEAFKVPTPKEAARDFLWRVHSVVPGKGEAVIFNRSHYEDVLVVRVHKLVPEEVWKKRYDDINNFERLLVDNKTVILKFCLLISKDEQEQRLLDREKDPTKAWKLSPGDWKERELWDDYQKAYDDVINKCAAPDAPWFPVPANHKWFRNVAIAEAIVEALRPFKDTWMKHLTELGAEELKALHALRQASS